MSSHQPKTPANHTSSHGHDELEDHDLGLQHDLPQIQRTQLGRRRLLGVIGGVGLVGVAGGLAACSTSESTSSTASSAAATASADDRPEPPGGGGGPGDGGGAGAESGVEAADGEIPEETAGPFPGDGTNGPNVLSESGVVRSDITSSFGSASGVAEGVSLTIKLKVYDLESPVGLSAARKVVPRSIQLRDRAGLVAKSPTVPVFPGKASGAGGSRLNASHRSWAQAFGYPKTVRPSSTQLVA